MISRLSYVSRVLSPRKYPCLLPYQMWLKSNARVTRSLLVPTYLVRQYFKSNLYDRLATRPFLTKMEKYWLIYQLLRAIELVHKEKLYHGDIKPENVMVTSWNMLVVTDFATFKPITLPEDDPTDFQYYFESSGRRRCYVAPERFVKRTRDTAVPSSETAGQGDLRLIENESATKKWGPGGIEDNMSRLTLGGVDLESSSALQAMDVFALGCTIAEILLDGVPLIDLPGILRYRAPVDDSLDPNGSGDSSPKRSSGPCVRVRYMERLDDEMSPCLVTLQRIKNPSLRELVCRMTCRNPDHRPKVSEILDIISQRDSLSEQDEPALPDIAVLPSYFGRYMYDFFLSVHWQGMLPDTRVSMLCEHYENIMKEVTGVSDEEGANFFKFCYRHYSIQWKEESTSNTGSISNETKRKLFSVSETPSKYKVSNINGPVGDVTSINHKNVAKQVYNMSVDELLEKCESLLGYVKEPVHIEGRSTEAMDGNGQRQGLDNSSCRGKFLERTSLINPARPEQRADGLIVLIEFICSNIRHLR